MISRIFSCLAVVLIAGTVALHAQDAPAPEATPAPAEVKIDLTKEQTDGIQIAELSIAVYSGLRGREGLSQIRKTTVEIGTTSFTDPGSPARNASYEKKVIRGESFSDEKIRLDQKFPNADYAMIFDGGKVFGVSNNIVFAPRDDAERAFRNRLVHGVEALLRYKENGSTVVLEKSDRVMGVDFYIIVLTDNEGRKTKYFVSKKTLRVLMLEYEDLGIKYKRKFYDHNYAQGTLVPYRTVLWANEKQVEESRISTITFGQVVSDSLFAFATP